MYLCFPIISEDSDIIAFGAETVFFKMDRDGNGREYRRKLLGACDKCGLTHPVVLEARDILEFPR